MRSPLLLALLLLGACAHFRQGPPLKAQVASNTERIEALEGALTQVQADGQRMRQGMVDHSLSHHETLATLREVMVMQDEEIGELRRELARLRRQLQLLAPTPTADPARLPAELPDDVAALLTLARRHHDDGKHEVARAILDHALKTHGEAPEAAELRYLFAETWFAQQQWSSAITAYYAVTEFHPESEQAAWALVRQGQCVRAMGDLETARIYFEDVTRQHPESDAADTAWRLLEGLADAEPIQ